MALRKGYNPPNTEGRTFQERCRGRQSIQGRLGMYFVPTWHLREEINPLIDREGKYLCEDGDYAAWGDNGKLLVIAERVSKITGLKVESCYRKIFDICTTEEQPRDNVSADFAEAMFIACGERMEDYEVPHFPAAIEGALEMALVWADEGEDVMRLAHLIMRFSLGYGMSDQIVDPERHESIVHKRNESRRKRKRALATAA